MALTEAPDPDFAANRHAKAVKAWTRDTLRQLVAELGSVDDPAVLADQLVLVMEGVYASVQALGVDGPARQGRALAEALIQTHTQSAAPRRQKRT